LKIKKKEVKKMKKIVLVLMTVCLVSSLALAAEVASPAVAVKPADVVVKPVAVAVKTVMLKGDIIDNMCAGAHKDALADFVKTHTKQCAIAPGCVDSGYSIFADGKLSKFDKDSNVKIVEFLKKEDSKLQVVVTAKKVAGELSLVSIENQK